jgi:glycosyl transferase family 25
MKLGPMLVLINLDAAVERRTVMTRQLDALRAERGFTFERVGVDLRRVCDGEVEAQINARFPGLEFDRKALSNAEIGCWLSHLTAWQRLLCSGHATCTVIEDDLTLLPGFAAAVESLSRRTSHDLVYLGTSSRNVSQRRRTDINGVMVHDAIGVIYNTWGYSIQRAYAERFFAPKRRRIAAPIDHFLGGRGRRPRAHIGVVQPAVLQEDPVLGAASQIGPYTRRLDRSVLIQDIRRRLLASPASALYYSLYRYL